MAQYMKADELRSIAETVREQEMQKRMERLQEFNAYHQLRKDIEHAAKSGKEILVVTFGESFTHRNGEKYIPESYKSALVRVLAADGFSLLSNSKGRMEELTITWAIPGTLQ